MSELQDYLRMLFGGRSGFVYAPIKTPTEWVQKFYAWPAESIALENWITTNSFESDVYISPALYKEKSAKREHVLGAQVVWAEFDGQESVDLSGVPEPTMRVQTSSPTHEHLYWQIEFAPPQVLEDINRRLTYFLDADSSGCESNQVLRPPGTLNHKHDSALPVNFSAAAVEIEPLSPSAFDGLPPAPPLVDPTKLGAIPDPIDVLTLHTIPKDLYDLIKDTDPTPVGLRSTKLMHIGHRLAEMGLDHGEIVSILLFADERIRKFLGRSDQLTRLIQIASIAINKHEVESTSLLPIYSGHELLATETTWTAIWGEFLGADGNISIAGPPNVGKTQFSLQAAMHFLLNKSLVGEAVHFTDVRPLLFIEMEMATHSTKRFFLKMLKNFTLDEQDRILDKIRFVTSGDDISPKDIEYYLDKVKPAGVFFDSIVSLAQKSMSDEEEAKRQMSWDAKIRRTFNCFTWYIQHNRKTTNDNKKPFEADDVYGNRIYSAKFDTIFMMYPTSKVIHLTSVKNRFTEKKQYDIVRDKNTLTFSLKANDPTSPVTKGYFGTGTNVQSTDNTNSGSTGKSPEVDLGFGDPDSGYGDEQDSDSGE